MDERDNIHQTLMFLSTLWNERDLISPRAASLAGRLRQTTVPEDGITF